MINWLDTPSAPVTGLTVRYEVTPDDMVHRLCAWIEGQVDLGAGEPLPRLDIKHLVMAVREMYREHGEGLDPQAWSQGLPDPTVRAVRHWARRLVRTTWPETAARL